MRLYLFSFFYSQQMAAHQGIARRVRDFPAAGGHRNGSVTFSAEGHVSPKGENPFCNTLNKSVGDKWRRKMATEQVPRSVAIEQMSIDPWIMEAVNKGNCFIKVKGWYAGPQLVAFQSGGLATGLLFTANNQLQPCCKYGTFLLFIAFYHFAFLLFLPYVGSLFLHMALSSISTVVFLIFFMHFIFSYFLPSLTLILFLFFPVFVLLSCHFFRILFLSFGCYLFTFFSVSHADTPITILSCSLYRNCYGNIRPPPWSSGQSSWLQIQRSIPGATSFFWEVVGLERGPPSLVSTIEELLRWNISGSGLESREYYRGDPLRWPRDILYLQKLVLTSPISGGRSVGIVR
jgi:hypothetical protein